MKHLIAAGVVIVLTIGGLYAYLHIYTDHSEHVEVPDVKGISIESAGDMLSEVGLNYVLIDSVYSPKGIGGSILEQNPPALARVKRNRDIYLTIYRSTAPTEELKVKEGMAEGVAEIILKNKGIRFEKTYESNQVLAGLVVKVKKDKETLKPNSRIMRGEKVTLVVGKGSEEKVGIPSLKGLSLDSAEKVLQQARLTLGYPFYEGELFTLEDSMQCTVQGQAPNPTSGKKVLVGTPIDLYLKIKLEEPTPPDTTDISNL